MKNTKTFDELVQIVDQNLKEIEEKEQAVKKINRKDKIKNFGKMLIEGIGNTSLGGANFQITRKNEEYIYDDLLGIHSIGLTRTQIDAVMLARDVQEALNSTKGVFTDTEAAQMIQTKDDMYNIFKKQFETNKIQLS